MKLLLFGENDLFCLIIFHFYFDISFFNIVYKTQKCMGIHLFHQNAYQGYCKDKVSNKPIFDYKTKMWKDTQKYISILDTESI